MVQACILPLIFSIILFNLTDAAVIWAKKGSSVHLPCPLQFQKGTVSVEWEKNGAQQLCGYYVTRNHSSFHSNSSEICRIGVNSSGLTLSYVQYDDSGNYTCTQRRIIPPPVEEALHTTSLHVEGLSLERLNSSVPHCMELRCTLEGVESEDANFTWRREGQGLPEQVWINHTAGTRSSLFLCKPDWREGDTFTCSATLTNRTQFSQNISVPAAMSEPRTNSNLMLFIASGGAGTVVIITVAILCVCKCKKKAQSSGPVFYNKVYENFSFSTLQNAEGQALAAEDGLYEICSVSPPQASYFYKQLQLYPNGMNGFSVCLSGDG
ncbi:uncharacterized protein LOC114792825 [Denticeps clupeoides]|uniref:uncharacterized protein LOC114792825 n=1 Tax=Denticeps clupeoides TaxID=299321 RepID=UPI0010A4307F|nr:uncharacterized protein LOC114792825 [Denticeps clupeoides]